MKKLLFISTAMCFASSVVYAQNTNTWDIKPYIESKISGNLMKASYSEPDLESQNVKDTLFGASLATGLKINNNYRVELEGYYNGTLKDDLLDIIPTKIKTKGFFINGYYDIDLPTTDKLKPYVGAGIGYSWVEGKLDLTQFDLENESAKDEDINYNIGLGLGYQVNQNIDLTLGYRYEYLGKLKANGSDTTVKNNKFLLGFRYTF